MSSKETEKESVQSGEDGSQGGDVSGDSDGKVETGEGSSGEELKATSTTSPENKPEKQSEKTVEEPRKKKKPPESTKKSNPSYIETTDSVELNNPPKQGDKQKQDKQKQPAGFMNICNSVVILLVLAFACIFAAILLGPPEPEIETDFDLPKIFENKLMDLQSSFTNQTDRFWRIVKNRGMAHLRNTNPPQPLVLLLAAPPAAHNVVDCLATILAKVLDPRHKRTFATIDGTEEKSFHGEKAKKKMDELLRDKFKAGHRVALVHHLELLPPPSPLLFYSYCDDQNAPHKHVAIIFTVHLPTEPDVSLSPKEAEGTVEKYLSKEVWAQEDQDSVAALLSRVADTVALMNGEASDSVKASCP